MRAISKQSGGGHLLSRSHATPPKTAKNATSRWNSFAGKAALLQDLLEEQYQLCCYSELRADEEGLGYHIEHIENKSQNPTQTFDYSNLAACALGSANDLSSFKTQGHAVFGGHASGKQNAVDMKRFISCLQADCQRYFAYLSDGRVVPANNLDDVDKDRAGYTIDLLSLNSPYLITRRQQWWNELDNLFQEHQNKDWSLPDLVSVVLLPRRQGLSRFFSLTRRFFGQVAEDTLRQHASELV